MILLFWLFPPFSKLLHVKQSGVRPGTTQRDGRFGIFINQEPIRFQTAFSKSPEISFQVVIQMFLIQLLPLA